MDNSILITRYPTMDFILTQIFSIILFSRNGITLKQKIHLEETFHKTPSLVALYPKGLPIQKSDCSWKRYGNRQNPCLVTTAYSIQLLAKTANFILESTEVFKEPSYASVIGKELADLSVLQLDYCLENLKDNPYSTELYTSLLEACLAVSELKGYQSYLDANWFLNYDDEADTLYNKIASNLDMDSINTLELSKIINAFHQIASRFSSHPAKDIIPAIALELTCRRNSLGLFQRYRIQQKTAPLSWQFHCIASLLLSYSIYPIDKILDEAFSAFNHLYQLSWDPAIDLLSFSRKIHTRYTSFEIAAIIKALCLLSSWVSEEEQKKQLDHILVNSYFSILSDEFFSNYHQSIRALYRRFMDNMQLSYNQSSEGYSADIHRAPVFPAAIQINPAYGARTLQEPNLPRIRWINRSPLKLRYPLELCIYLLDYLRLYHQNQKQFNEEEMPFSWLDLLFSMIPQED